MALTYAELFAGAGGMSLGLEAGGFHAAAHAEWDHHARAVLRYRWPDTRLDGDVTEINGADYTGITLLSGGSPCQDLSVAGKRAGLTGSRSSLFHQQVRIWHESGAPYLLWENVAGALSSNKGRDFATVLSTIVGSTVTVPADGWRGGGGVVAGRDAVAAFRVLDLQHFGPPQRRVRVFILAARAGGVDPAEVLALAEGVCGHPSPRQQSREIAASGTGGGVEGRVVPYTASRFAQYEEGIGQLRAAGGDLGGGSETILAFHHTQTPISGDVAPAVGRPTNGMGVFVDPGMESWKAAEVIEPMCARDYKDAAAIVVGNSGMESWKTVDVAIGLAARDAKGANNVVIGTLDFGGHGGSYNGQDASSVRILPSGGRPRRLTPLECERLMSWPDQWTATGRKDDGTEYQLSDTARYRLCGNGVGSVCAEWIARRLHDAIHRQEKA
jgi:DNA (cytosine-5)-methyltransferase 1